MGVTPPKDLQGCYFRNVHEQVMRRLNVPRKIVGDGIAALYGDRVTDVVRAKLRWRPYEALDKFVSPIMDQLDAPGRF